MDRPDYPVVSNNEQETTNSQWACRWWSSMAWIRWRRRRHQQRLRGHSQWLVVGSTSQIIMDLRTESDLAKDMIMILNRINRPLLVQVRVISFLLCVRVCMTSDPLIKVAIVVVQSSIARLTSYWLKTNTGTFLSLSCVTPPKKSCPSWLIGCLI